MFEMYDVLHEKMQTCKKPIFPILPSINTAGAEVAAFLAKGHVNFADEVTLGTALSRIVNVPKPAVPEIELFGVDVPRIRRIIDSIPENGYIASNYVQALLHAAGTPLVDEFVSDNKEELVAFVRRCRFLIHSLRAYIIIQGTRGQKRVKEDKFAETIVRLSALLHFATEIKEMDINPFLAAQRAVITVDACIRIEK